jgi:hypothetical protein
MSAWVLILIEEAMVYHNLQRIQKSEQGAGRNGTGRTGEAEGVRTPQAVPGAGKLRNVGIRTLNTHPKYVP